MQPTTRRRFLRSSAISLSAGIAARRLMASSSGPLRAVVIGSTGRGDYGHRHEVIFRDRPGVKVAAVADPDEAGRAAALKRAGAIRGYADYAEMLERERPDLAVVCPRHTDQHFAMAMAALKSGAHVYLEKPMTTTLAQADALLEEAGRRRRKIVVAHQMRLAPGILLLKKALDDKSLIGELLELRIFGKQDERAGGEDMLVLGTHLFDLARFFAGDPRWCAARVLTREGRDITPADAHPGKHDVLGPVAGDQISAQFAFDKGVNATFVSRRRQRAWPYSWGMLLIGSEGAAWIRAGHPPRIDVVAGGGDPGEPLWYGEWTRWSDDPGPAEEALPSNAARMDAGNQRLLDDWLEAIAQDRPPVCSGEAGMRSLEMIHAVWAAGLAGRRVAIPLARREHPLTPSAE